jgi:hypothetical protein
MRRFNNSIVVALATLLFVSICSAQQTATTAVPNLIRYSGTLKDAQGTASVPSTTIGVTFAIYKQQDGGAAVWQETQNVTPDTGGQYSVILGSTTATGLPDDLFSQQEQRWLGVQVQGEAEQARVLLVSVPYAFKAHEAETLGGLPASAFVKAAPTEAPLDGSNGTALNALSNAGSAGGASRTKGNAASGKPKTSPACGTIMGGGTQNFIPLWTTPDGCTLGNSLMSQLTAGRVDVNGNFNLLSTAGAYQIGASTVLSILGTNNLFAGVGAGSSNTGAQNTFVGANAGNRNVGGNYNTFIGEEAGWLKNQGDHNAFTGYRAGYRNFNGKFNAFFGSEAGHYNNGSNNVFVGYGANYGPLAYAGNTGDNNTIVGFEAGRYNTANNNSFYGYQAGYNNTVDGNSFFGYQAGYNNTTATENTFLGYQSGYSNTTGELGASGNTFVGYKAGYSSNNIALGNTFTGDQAGYSVTSGEGNTFTGYKAGYKNTFGENNTYYGSEAGGSNDGGSENTSVGFGAGGGGYRSTIVGALAGEGNVGSDNIFLGYQAGFNNTPGGSNIYIGNEGCAYPCPENNTMRIGNEVPSPEYPPYQTATYIAGIYDKDVDINTAQIVLIDSAGKLGTIKMLLSTLQKQDLQAAAQQDVIKTQQQQINDLQQRLSRLESLMVKK